MRRHFKLAFDDPRLERLFLAAYLETARKPARATFLLVAALFAGYATLDVFLVPDRLGTLLVIRGVTIVILLVLTAIAFSPLYDRLRGWLGLAGSLVSAGSLLAMQAVAPEFLGAVLYQDGIGLVILGTCTLLRLRMPFLIATVAVIVAMYLVTAPLIGLGAVQIVPALFLFTSAAALGLLAAYALERAARRSFLDERRIEAERARSERLLRNILPGPIAERLKNSQEPIADHYDEVSILFADLVGFTRMSTTLPPEELVAFLNGVFTEFDRIGDRFRLEKIKTIGDAFMAAAGLLRAMSDPVLACVQCGLDMIQAAHELDPPWELRIGVHVGPLVGGILGRRQYLFDLVGDTVNTASRIESAGVPGAVCLSGPAWQRIDHLSVGRSLGRVEVKGKGEIEIVRFERFR